MSKCTNQLHNMHEYFYDDTTIKKIIYKKKIINIFSNCKKIRINYTHPYQTNVLYSSSFLKNLLFKLNV